MILDLMSYEVFSLLFEVQMSYRSRKGILLSLCHNKQLHVLVLEMQYVTICDELTCDDIF